MFAFVILQIIALSLYFTGKATDNKRAFLTTANSTLGAFYESSSRFANYWNLAAVNDSLARENAELQMQLPSSKFSAFVDITSVDDSLLLQKYEYMEAKVVNNTIHRPHNYITINKGLQQGVKPNMGIINAGSNGIVGITYKSSNNYSLVMSTLNIDIKLSAKINRNNYFGSLIWNGRETKQMELEAIPKHADIKKGDTVVTSGYSTMFPEGIMIGTIDTFFVPAGRNFYSITIDLINDMNAVQYVYVVNNLQKEEQLKLEEEVGNE